MGDRVGLTLKGYSQIARGFNPLLATSPCLGIIFPVLSLHSSAPLPFFTRGVQPPAYYWCVSTANGSSPLVRLAVTLRCAMPVFTARNNFRYVPTVST